MSTTIHFTSIGKDGPTRNVPLPIYELPDEADELSSVLADAASGANWRVERLRTSTYVVTHAGRLVATCTLVVIDDEGELEAGADDAWWSFVDQVAVYVGRTV